MSRRSSRACASAKGQAEALDVYRQLTLAAARDTEVSINYLGSLHFDQRMHEAIARQEVHVELYRGCQHSSRLAEMVQNLVDVLESTRPKGTIQFFWEHLLAE